MSAEVSVSAEVLVFAALKDAVGWSQGRVGEGTSGQLLLPPALQEPVKIHLSPQTVVPTHSVSTAPFFRPKWITLGWVSRPRWGGGEVPSGCSSPRVPVGMYRSRGHPSPRLLARPASPGRWLSEHPAFPDSHFYSLLLLFQENACVRGERRLSR